MERAFRLAGLLRLRKMQEDQAAAQLAVSNAQVRAAQHRRDTHQAELDTLPTPTTSAGWAISVMARSSLRSMIADANIDVSDAQQRAVTDTTAWAAARSRSVGLEKLETKHRDAVRVEDDRAEQIALDEVASRRAGDAAALTSTTTS